jgi:hypothetical protein
MPNRGWKTWLVEWREAARQILADAASLLRGPAWPGPSAPADPGPAPRPRQLLLPGIARTFSRKR